MLQLLQQADRVLSACGRPEFPSGLRWVDLPRVMPYRRVIPPGVLTQTSDQIANEANTVFLSRAFFLRSSAPNTGFRIRWPDGRFLERLLATQNGSVILLPERPIPPGESWTLQLLGTPVGEVSGGTFVCDLWGVNRYYLKADGSDVVQWAPDLTSGPRIPAGPNQNILAPEWMFPLCAPETPDGYQDESFTLFSPLISWPVGSGATDVSVQIPGDADFVIRAITYDTGSTGPFGTAIANIRLPDGYSLMGGDFISNQMNGATFPELWLRAGTRMFVDTADQDSGGGPGNLTLQIQFDGVKRRRKQ